MLKTPLSASRWAKSAPRRTNATQKPTPDSPDDVQKISRLLDRLKWKAGLLTVSHNEAYSSSSSANPLLQRMFKLDFFEFYALLERVLVHLLAFHRVSVRTTGNGNGNGTSELNRSIVGSSNVTKDPQVEKELRQERIMASHRYHADVLEAFDKPHNPLHEILGTGQVKSSLQEAKDLRNRAKDAEEVEVDAAAIDTFKFLDKAALEKMLSAILEALQKALELTQKLEAEVKRNGDGPKHTASWQVSSSAFDNDGDIMMDEDVPFDAVMDMAD